MNGVGVGYAVEAFPADIVGHSDLELMPEAGEVFPEGLTTWRQGTRGRRQGRRIAPDVTLDAVLPQAVLLRSYEGHFVFVVNFEVGDGKVDHGDYERWYRDSHRVHEVHVHLSIVAGGGRKEA
jgi:hypothetical protein